MYLKSRLIELALYIVNNDRESEDYLKHCEENEVNVSDYIGNSNHIYALAKVVLDEIDDYLIVNNDQLADTIRKISE